MKIPLGLFILMTSLIGSTSAATQTDGALHGWKLLAPLPDPVGYAGMFGGVLHDRVVVGGGSQFPSKPFWLKGEKAFSDRIFTLSTLSGKWEEHATKLPYPVANCAMATTAEAIYLAGGVNAEGCLRHVLEIRADGKNFTFKRLPELPEALCYTSGGIAGGRLYVVGGATAPAAKTATAAVWSLDLSAGEKGVWKREADVPGHGIFVTSMASDGEAVYLFGGVEFDAAGKSIPLKTAYRLGASGGQWERLPDLPAARVGPTYPAHIVSGKVFLIGGYAEIFPGAPREHPGFSSQTLYYDLSRKTWSQGPRLPQSKVSDRDSPTDLAPSPMVAAPTMLWRDHVIVVGGETRSSTRTPVVLAWPLKGTR